MRPMSLPVPLVLVADDEPSMLELVARHLRTMKDPAIEVIEASDGEQAWSLAQEHLPDLVVLDVMMPGMSGWEVCRKIREDVSLAHTGVLMLTGIGENLNQLTSPLYGADAYIDKPFDFGELDNKVRVALEAREGQRDGISRPRLNGVAGVARPAKKAKTAKKAKRAKEKAAARVKSNGAKKPVRVAKGGKSGKVAKKAGKAAKKAGAKLVGRSPAARKPKTAKKGGAKKSATKNGTAVRNGRNGRSQPVAKAASKRPKATKAKGSASSRKPAAARGKARATR